MQSLSALPAVMIKQLHPVERLYCSRQLTGAGDLCIPLQQAGWLTMQY